MLSTVSRALDVSLGSKTSFTLSDSLIPFELTAPGVRLADIASP